MKDITITQQQQQQQASANCKVPLSQLARHLTAFQQAIEKQSTTATWNMFSFPIPVIGPNNMAAFAVAADGSNSNSKNGNDTSWFLSSAELLRAMKMDTFFRSTVAAEGAAPVSPTSSSSSSSPSSSLSSSSTTLSLLPDIYERMNIMSQQMLSENRIVTNITRQLEEAWNNWFNQTMQVGSTGLVVGAVVGAAVATGIMLGMISVAASVVISRSGSMDSSSSSSSNIISNSCSNSTSEMSSWLNWFLRRHQTSDRSSTKMLSKENDKHDDKSAAAATTTTTTTAAAAATSVATGHLIILQAHPGTATISLEDTSTERQCQSCLQQLDEQLVQHNVQWRDLRRLTVYLVSGRCEAKVLRKGFQDYQQIQQQQQQHHHHHPVVQDSIPVLSILYVQQLEDEKAVIQIEALASSI